MNRNGLLFHLIGLILSVPLSAPAAELYNFYDGVRGLGMGGVQIPTVNDETALLINPAALGKLRDVYSTVVDPQVEINNLASKTLVEAQGINALLDTKAMVTALQQHQDQHYHVAAQVFPSLVLSNFGIGFFGIETHDAEHSSETGLVHYDHRRDMGVALGYNLRLWEGRIKLGVTGRYFDRTEADADIDASLNDKTLGDIARNASAIAADVGLILTAPITFLPSITGVVHDVGGTEFGVNSGFFYPQASAPYSVRQTLDVGASISPIITNHFRMQIAVEFRDMMNPVDLERDNAYRRAHAGLEINVADFMFLRGGWNQKYWTAGFELTTRVFQLQGATYGEDIGTAGEAREDRRYTLKAAFRF